MSLSLHAASTDSCSEAVVCCKIKSPHSFSIRSEKVSTRGRATRIEEAFRKCFVLRNFTSYKQLHFKIFLQEKEKRGTLLAIWHFLLWLYSTFKTKKYAKKVLHREGWWMLHPFMCQREQHQFHTYLAGKREKSLKTYEKDKKQHNILVDTDRLGFTQWLLRFLCVLLKSVVLSKFLSSQCHRTSTFPYFVTEFYAVGPWTNMIRKLFLAGHHFLF